MKSGSFPPHGTARTAIAITRVKGGPLQGSTQIWDHRSVAAMPFPESRLTFPKDGGASAPFRAASGYFA